MNKTASMIVASLGMAFAVPAMASNDGPIGPKSVDWYVAHPKERGQQRVWCEDQAITVQMNSQACSQVGRATSKVMAGATRKIPRVTLEAIRPSKEAHQ